jgi:uncharacterized protein YutE (UPF0331/DUF86 family)
MIDRARVEQHTKAVLQMVEALRRHQSHSVEELSADIDLLSAVAHELQIAVQSALDAGAHVLVAGGLNQFEEYRGIPERLAVHGVVPASAATALADLAGFRNVLVHHYLLVRIDLVHEKLRTAPDHLESFVRALIAWIDLTQPAPG